MRHLLLIAVIASCTPSITPGSYLCGPERLCPEGQACDGPTNVCVLETRAQPFACDNESIDPSNDNTPATGTLIDGLACVSNAFVTKGCLKPDDTADFFQLDVPASCTAVGVMATVSFPLAFVPLTTQIAKGTEAPQSAEVECPSSTKLVEGQETRCLDMVLEPGGHYAVGIVRDEAANADCDGACVANRYQLRLQLETP